MTPRYDHASAAHQFLKYNTIVVVAPKVYSHSSAPVIDERKSRRHPHRTHFLRHLPRRLGDRLLNECQEEIAEFLALRRSFFVGEHSAVF